MNNFIKDKAKKTCLKKYGVENPGQNKEIKLKIKKTCLEKYGVESSFQSELVQKKIRNSLISKYGVENPSQIKDVSKQIGESLKKYGEASFIKSCERNNLKPIDLNYNGLYNDKPIYYKCECLKCHNIVEISPHNKNFKCVYCYGKNSISSFIEKEILIYIKSIYNGEIVENDRRTISPLELDILIPEKKVAIEFNGDFWHNEFNKDKNYHKEKTEKCLEKGIHLIQIFEYQWLSSKNAIKSILKSFLVKNENIIFARKCTIKEISTKEYNNFCNENHLQGICQAKVKLGLVYNNKLVQIESFGKPRFSKKYEYELVRECSLKNTTVVGGKSKLFKYFIKNYNPSSIVSYCDAQFFSGNSYIKCGMKLLLWNDPGYVWCKQHQTLSRYQCQKHKLIEKHPELKDKTEIEIMHSLGYYRIYDCGQKVFYGKNNYFIKQRFR